MKTYEGIICILCHTISYWFKSEKEATDDIKNQLSEEAEYRAEECIKQGYSSGELNYETDNFSASGWWGIDR